MKPDKHNNEDISAKEIDTEHSGIWCVGLRMDVKGIHEFRVFNNYEEARKFLYDALSNIVEIIDGLEVKDGRLWEM